MDWLRDLEQYLDMHSNRLFTLRLWVRDKALSTADLPIRSLRLASKRLKLQLQWSWCHRNEAHAHERLHIPDDPHLREASIADSGRRILSCHSLQHASVLLVTHPRDHVLLSPWAPSLSKTHQNEPLNQRETIRLAWQFPHRIHLVSGLTPSDLKSLSPHPFESFCLWGALRGNMASCLEQLQAQYRVTS